jgi:hypothetical protein
MRAIGLVLGSLALAVFLTSFAQPNRLDAPQAQPAASSVSPWELTLSSKPLPIAATPDTH